MYNLLNINKAPPPQKKVEKKLGIKKYKFDDNEWKKYI